MGGRHRGRQIRCIEIILAGNSDQGEQRIAAGIGERSAKPMGRSRFADRADRPVRGDPFAEAWTRVVVSLIRLLSWSIAVA